MKDKLKLLCLLLVITAGTLAFVESLLPSIAQATYVEGVITQDTIWTLMDSPFVVSRNTTISQSATLIVEPGVEVKFGGDFSLNVEGTLSAIGEEDNMIKFTSNKDEPIEGDWNAIVFKGTVLSKLTYCTVEYARSGITIQNGAAEVKNSEITNSLENGIYITGDNQVSIQNNTISSNTNGILLAGDSTTGVSIIENIVMSNTFSGIQLDADSYSGLVILDNILSANNNGFYVSGETSTYITRNSISFNTIGIFYEGGWNHVAYYNDIYDNTYGMDVSDTFDSTVNAEYNYWGHESGPHHISLNPSGKGNSIGGDGVDLDFVFFLTAPIGYINTRPLAALFADKALAPRNQVVTFIASTSRDDRRVDKYFYDFGDGSNSDWTTLSIFTHKYSSTGTYNASVTVMDDFGVTSINLANAIVNVQNLNPLNTVITPSQSVIGALEQISVTVHVTDGTNPAENASVTLFAVRSGNFTPSSGLTNSTGYFTTTFVAPNVTQTANVRITTTASKSSYADGSDYEYLVVLPPLLVEVTAYPSLIEPEATSQVTAHVTYGGQPVAYTEVTVWSDSGGNFSAETGTTNSNGNVAFTFTAPQTTDQINITITATATKAGYATSEGQAEITVRLGTLGVQITANPTAIESRASSTIVVQVTYDANPIANVGVTVWSDSGGNFSAETGTTNSNGNVAFTFTAPQTTSQLNITIGATASKSWYADGHSQIELVIFPEYIPTDGGAGALPITTILLIAVPIIVVAILAVMIKLRIIYIAPE